MSKSVLDRDDGLSGRCDGFGNSAAIFADAFECFDLDLAKLAIVCLYLEPEGQATHSADKVGKSRHLKRATVRLEPEPADFFLERLADAQL